MAQYISRDCLNFLNDFRIDSGKYFGLRLDDVFDELATSDVVGCDEYNKLQTMNQELQNENEKLEDKLGQIQEIYRQWSELGEVVDVWAFREFRKVLGQQDE